MKNSWLPGILIVMVAIGVLFALNYQNRHETISLNDIFQDEQTQHGNVEYEFVRKEESPLKMTLPLVPTNAMVVPATSAQTLPPTAQTFYAIQVLSFQDKAKADKALEQVKKIEASAYISSKNIEGKGIWYRVYAGKFESKVQAQDVLLKIQKDFPNSFITIMKQ